MIFRDSVGNYQISLGLPLSTPVHFHHPTLPNIQSPLQSMWILPSNFPTVNCYFSLFCFYKRVSISLFIVILTENLLYRLQTILLNATDQFLMGLLIQGDENWRVIWIICFVVQSCLSRGFSLISSPSTRTFVYGRNPFWGRRTRLNSLIVVNT